MATKKKTENEEKEPKTKFAKTASKKTTTLKKTRKSTPKTKPAKEGEKEEQKEIHTVEVNNNELTQSDTLSVETIEPENAQPALDKEKDEKSSSAALNQHDDAGTKNTENLQVTDAHTTDASDSATDGKATSRKPQKKSKTRKPALATTKELSQNETKNEESEGSLENLSEAAVSIEESAMVEAAAETKVNETVDAPEAENADASQGKKSNPALVKDAEEQAKPNKTDVQSAATEEKQQKVKPIPPFPAGLRINSIVDLINAPHRQIILSDQQIQSLSLQDAEKRFRWIEGMLAWVLDYDVVISDTNIWLELLVGHTSSNSDPKVNARLLFERQLEFISKLVRYRGGRFMMMSETYEEIDRFATQQAPSNYKDVDFSDEAVCRNVAARLAKRLILSQQRENRLRIEGIGAESHHSAFADPAIIRKTVELFASGKKVLLITNDASVAIRSMGMCDDLQRHNCISDRIWDSVYVPIRPMVFTMDDLKVLDNYTRQYHFLQMAANKLWMEDVPQQMEIHDVAPLELWMDGFRPGDRYAEHHNNDSKQNTNNQQKQKQGQHQHQQQKQKQNAQQNASAQASNAQSENENTSQPKNQNANGQNESHNGNPSSGKKNAKSANASINAKSQPANAQQNEIEVKQPLAADDAQTQKQETVAVVTKDNEQRKDDNEMQPQSKRNTENVKAKRPARRKPQRKNSTNQNP